MAVENVVQTIFVFSVNHFNPIDRVISSKTVQAIAAIKVRLSMRGTTPLK